MPKSVTTFLMFEGSAEEAMRTYVTLFAGSEIDALVHYGPGEPGREGSVQRAEFTIAGHRLRCFDSPIGHDFTFTPAISLFVDCADEAEFESATEELSTGGEFLMPPNSYGFSRRFAWLRDRWGVSWQLNLP